MEVSGAIVALKLMKLKFLMVCGLALTMYLTGCGDKNNDTENAEATQPVVEEAEPDPLAGLNIPENDVIADDTYSNLQLTDVKKPVYDRYTLWERQAKNLPMQLPEITPYTEGKVAYLTFDDGPDSKNTPAILDILKNYGVPGTFYVVGQMVEANPDILKRIFDEGHAIGNHSYNHEYNQLYPSTENFLQQLTRTDDIIKSIIGVRPLIIRTPGGQWGMWTDDYPPLMKACGYVEHDWNCSVEDATYKRPSAQQMIKYIDQQTNEELKDNAAIILMHSNGGKENTVSALPGIIELLQNKGYSFGVITPMTPQPY